MYGTLLVRVNAEKEGMLRDLEQIEAKARELASLADDMHWKLSAEPESGEANSGKASTTSDLSN